LTDFPPKLEENAMKWLRKKKTIMVGIDVTHPGPGSRDGSPSIAAVVASVDDNFVQFPASLEIQKGKQEVGISNDSLDVPILMLAPLCTRWSMACQT
jgi:hypothetical protein